MNNRSLRLYAFGPFRLNVAEQQLQRGNEVVPLSPKVFDTLLVLVENSGHTLGKNELMEFLWPDSFVEESSLAQNISLLRRALGEVGGDRQYIETIPKRGYRFVADVQEVGEPNSEIVVQERTSTQFLIAEMTVHEPDDPMVMPATRIALRPQTRRPSTSGVRRPAIVGSIVLISLIAFFYFARQQRAVKDSLAARSLAVLPFKSINAQGHDEQLGLGMADAVIVKLSKIERVSVLPTTAVFKYTGRERNPMAAGHELGVDAVLDGTIQHSGDHIRVTVQLINVGNGRTLWSSKFDEQATGIFDLQDSISEQLARTLAPEISGGASRQLAKRITENADAYQAYLMGLYFWNKRTKENIAKAIPYFHQAVDKDPRFALAYAILADCYVLDAYNGYKLASTAEAWSRSNAAAMKAIELDETLAEPHTVMAFIKAARKDFVGAEQEHKRALELNPNFATGHLRYAYDLFNRFHLGEAVSEVRRAQELDPLSPVINSDLCFMLTKSRNYEEAIKYGRRAFELDPNLPAGRQNLAEAYADKGMLDEAIALFDGQRRNSALDRQYLAYLHAKAGRRQEARRMLSRLRQSFDREPGLIRDDRDLPYNFANCYLALGEKDKAFEWLERVEWDRFRIAKLSFDPQWNAMESDPRFESFVRRHNLPLAALEQNNSPK